MICTMYRLDRSKSASSRFWHPTHKIGNPDVFLYFEAVRSQDNLARRSPNSTRTSCEGHVGCQLWGPRSVVVDHRNSPRTHVGASNWSTQCHLCIREQERPERKNTERKNKIAGGTRSVRLLSVRCCPADQGTFVLRQLTPTKLITSAQKHVSHGSRLTWHTAVAHQVLALVPPNDARCVTTKKQCKKISVFSDERIIYFAVTTTSSHTQPKVRTHTS